MPTRQSLFEESEDFFDDELNESEDLSALSEPFDPRAIDITPESQNVQYLTDLLEDKLVDLNTEFQRSAYLWSATKMSRLIESLIIRLPIPPFYFAAAEQLPPTSDDPLQIVDGLQRLSAMQRYIVDEELKLTGLSFLKELEGRRFSKLDRGIQRALLRAQVSVYTIRPGTPKRVTYVLFERLNTGGLVLNPQEIRHALNQGIPTKYLTDLVALDSFRKLVRFRDGRMKDCELALRYMAFRITPAEQYQRPLKLFLDSAMEKIANTPLLVRTRLRSEFDRALNIAFTLFGENAFSKQQTRSQFNKALFETLTVCLSELTTEQQSTLQLRSQEIKQLYFGQLSDESSKLSQAVTSGTSGEEAIRNRFTEIRKLLQRVIDQT